LHGELKQYFRPEFLNRFDGIILFKELQIEDLKKIAGLMLQRVAKDLETKNIEMSFDESAQEFLAHVGFDPEFGARPMRRAVQEKIENKLADLLLSGQIGRGSKIHLGQEGEIIIL
jgi:ATP-dependent Clp protease ATP-binding subunit ClpA